MRVAASAKDRGMISTWSQALDPGSGPVAVSTGEAKKSRGGSRFDRAG